MLTSNLFSVETHIVDQKVKTDPDRLQSKVSIMANKLRGSLNVQAEKSANIEKYKKVNQSFFSSLKLNI